MLNFISSKNILLVFTAVLISFKAYSGVHNSVELSKAKPAGNMSVSIENVSIVTNAKLNKNINKIKPIQQPDNAKVKTNKATTNTETIYLKTSPNSPVVVNKTTQFVFRNVTQNNSQAAIQKDLEARTAKINYLRKQLKGY